MPIVDPVFGNEIVDPVFGPQEVARAREESAGRVFKSLGTGVAETVALPWAGADLIGRIADRSQGMEPPTKVPAGDRMKAAFGPLSLPPGDEPRGALERAAKFLGGSAATYPIGWGLGGAIAKTGGGKNFLTRALEETYRRPVASAASEIAAAGGAGFGGEVGASAYPDSPYGRAAFELMGGFAGPLAINTPASLAARGAVALGRGVKSRIKGDPTASSRVGAFLRTLVSDEQMAGLDDLDPELAKTLRLGQRMRSPSLLGADEALTGKDPSHYASLLAKAEEQALAAQKHLESLTEGGGDVGAAINAGRSARRTDGQATLAAVKAAVDARAAVAGLKADMTIQAIGSRADPEEIGRATRDVIDGEYQLARGWEREVHAKVNKTIPVTYDNFIEAHLDDVARLTTKDSDHALIPGWARDRVNDYMENSERTVGDLISLRRRFTDAARAEAGSEVPNRTRLTYYNKMQAALLKDLEGVPDTGAQEAAAVSRELNDKFTRGAVGQLLGYEKTGELSSIPAASMQYITRGLATEVGERIDDLLRAAPQARPQVEKYLVNEFLDHTFVEGEFDAKRAASFLGDQKNRIMLTRFQHLEKRFSDAKDMQREYQTAIESGQLEYNTLSDTWKKALKEAKPFNYNQEFTSAMSARRGGEDKIAAIRKEIGSDEMAIKGLQADVVGDVLDRSVRQITPSGVKIWDRAKLSKNLLVYKTRLDAAGVTEPQMKRLRTIVSFLERIDTPVGDRATAGDLESGAINRLAQIAGAEFGAAIPGRKTIQRSSIFSAVFKSKAAKWLKNMDRAKAEITEAMNDEYKFRRLYAEAPPPAKKIGHIFTPKAKYFLPGVGQTEDKE